MLEGLLKIEVSGFATGSQRQPAAVAGSRRQPAEMGRAPRLGSHGDLLLLCAGCSETVPLPLRAVAALAGAAHAARLLPSGAVLLAGGRPPATNQNLSRGPWHGLGTAARSGLHNCCCAPAAAAPLLELPDAAPPVVASTCGADAVPNTPSEIGGTLAPRGEGGGVSFRHDRNRPLHRNTATPPTTCDTANAAAAPKWCAWQSSS